MQNQITVRDLVNMLQSLDQDMPVAIELAMEYEELVTENMVEVRNYDGVNTLVITDTPWG